MRLTSWILLSSLGLAACGGGGEAPQLGGTGSSAGDTPGDTPGGILADLFVETLSASSATVEAGGSLSVQDSVRNAGQTAAGASVLAVYLSTDESLDDDDVLLGTRGVPALEPGAASEAQGSLTVPAGTPPGSYRLIAFADAEFDVVEAQELNNLHVATGALTIEAGALANLVPSQLSFSPASLDAGQLLSVSEAVRNDGEGAAGTFQVGVYLSLDPSITPSDRLLGLRSVSGLAVGALSFGDDDLLVPANTPEGTYWVGVLVDVGGTQPELDEFDNVLVASGQVSVHRPPRPDLVATAVSFGATAIDAGQTLTVANEVQNLGVVDAGAFRVGCYISEDSEITTDDLLLGERSLSGLAIGATSAAQGSYEVPAEIGAGTRYIGLVVDHANAILEQDETNNALLAAGTVEVSIPPLPDLRPTALSVSPSVLQVGESVTVVERVINEGTAPAAPFRVGVYLSTNPVIATTDVLLGSRVVDGLAMGGSSEAQSSYALPIGVAAGSWYVGVIVDDLRELPELQEGDGTLLSPTLIDVTAAPDPHPDLVIEAISTPVQRVLSGGSLQVLSTVRNEGDLSSTSFQVGIYLSTDATITTEDRLIGQRTVFSLGVGFGSAQSFPYTIPTDVPLGFYRLGAIADNGQVIAELDEDNNALAASGQVEVYVPPPPAPDLSVTSIAVNTTTLTPGGSLTIDDVVRNSGELASGTTRVAFYLSEDSEVDTTDTLLGVRTVAGLSVGSESSGSTTVSLPSGLAAGSWTLAAIVDDTDSVSESDEENNSKSLSEALEVE
jgi:large repetitive protein